MRAPYGDAVAEETEEVHEVQGRVLLLGCMSKEVSDLDMILSWMSADAESSDWLNGHRESCVPQPAETEAPAPGGEAAQPTA